MVVLDEIKGSSISKKPNSTMSVMLCTGATFIKKNSCLVARIIPFGTADLLKYDGNIVVKYVFSMPCCRKDFSKPSCVV